MSTATAAPELRQRSFPALTSGGQQIDPPSLGWLSDASLLLDDAAALRARMEDDGYLYLPGLLERRRVLAARRTVTGKLMDRGLLEPGTDPMDSVARRGARTQFLPELAQDNPQLMDLLYAGTMIEFFQHLLGEPVRHYDYTWFRAVGPGHGTPVHCDVVYMGRGERQRLFTAWTPIGDIGFDQGGLILLEGSNNHQRLRQTYGESDVDTFCSNRTDARDAWERGQNGSLKGDVNRIRRSLGVPGRWLTGDYRAGDLLVFSIFTVHASLDNHSDRIRLSSDSRYQPASSPADERWIGVNPPGHGQAGKRGRVC
jgi:hypothetical protein